MERIDIKTAIAEAIDSLSHEIDILHEKQAKGERLTFDDVSRISSLRNSLSAIGIMCPSSIFPTDCKIERSSERGHFFPCKIN